MSITLLRILRILNISNFNRPMTKIFFGSTLSSSRNYTSKLPKAPRPVELTEYKGNGD